MGLQGKVAIITGAKGGLGNVVTSAFLEAGATVAGVSRSIQDSDFPHRRFGAIQGELGSEAAAANVVSQTVARFGKIDILVHLVGGFAGGVPVAQTAASVFDQMIDVNLRSFFYVSRAVLPILREQSGGRIISVGSRAAAEANAGSGVYSASKAAVIALTRAIALENKDRGITANVVLPGTMDTPANRAAMPSADWAKWVRPESVANVIVALASDSHAEITGATIPVYGGEA